MEIKLKVEILEEVDSTNEYLKRIPPNYGLAVIAKRQLSGKGRRGKRWLSPYGKGLYLSVMFPTLDPVKAPLSSLAFGVATVKVLLSLSDRFYLKWPNDIYIEGKKVGGILPELLPDRLIIGTGINLEHTADELFNIEQPATSLKLEGIEFNKEELTYKLLESYLNYYGKLERGEFSVREFEEFCPMIGKEVTVIEETGSYCGKALGIDRNGCLIVETDSGIVRLFSGNVSVREEKKS